MTDETLTRIADALERLVDAYAQAQRRDHYALTDRYAANEARQREEASMGLVECLREIERTRPGSDDRPTSEQFQEGLALAYDWLRSALRDHGVVVSSRPEPDPLDEADHRDRVLADGSRLVRSFRGHWHTPQADCQRNCTSKPDPRPVFTLALWDGDHGPLAFAPDASPAPQDAAQGAAEGESDAVEGGEAAGPNLNVQIKLLCQECGHDIEQHRGFGCIFPLDCRCGLSVTDIARHLIAQATS